MRRYQPSVCPNCSIRAKCTTEKEIADAGKRGMRFVSASLLRRTLDGLDYVGAGKSLTTECLSGKRGLCVAAKDAGISCTEVKYDIHIAIVIRIRDMSAMVLFGRSGRAKTHGLPIELGRIKRIGGQNRDRDSPFRAQINEIAVVAELDVDRQIRRTIRIVAMRTSIVTVFRTLYANSRMTRVLGTQALNLQHFRDGCWTAHRLRVPTRSASCRIAAGLLFAI